jgi:hypothetical protein
VIFGWPPLWSNNAAPVRGNWWFFLQADSYVLTAMCFIVFMAYLVIRNEGASAGRSLGDDPALVEVSPTPGRRARWLESQVSG